MQSFLNDHHLSQKLKPVHKLLQDLFIKNIVLRSNYHKESHKTYIMRYLRPKVTSITL